MGDTTFLNSRWFGWIRGVFAVVMLAVLAAVLVDGASQVTWAPDITGRFVLSAILATAGLLAGAAAWAAVIGSDLKLALITFGATLPLRHLPLGGVAQIVGMAGLAKLAEERSGPVSYTTPAAVATTASGAAPIAIPALWIPSTPLWLKAFVVMALVAAALLAWRGPEILRLALRKIGRRDPGARRSWFLPVLWSAMSAIAGGLSFAVLIPEAGNMVTVTGAFAAAWLCGYVMVLAPAGLGVREGALVLMLTGVTAPTVVATGLLYRLATLVGDLLLFVVSWWFSRALRKEGIVRDGD